MEVIVTTFNDAMKTFTHENKNKVSFDGPFGIVTLVYYVTELILDHANLLFEISHEDEKDDLNAALDDMKSERYVRMNKMLEALHKLGFKIKMEDILLESGSAAPGRLHLARLLLRKKYVHSLDEAFSMYLGRDKPAYVSRKFIQVEDVLNLLRSSGAVPVLAHPGVDGKHYLNKLVKLGLKGVEAFHPDHSPTLIRFYRHMAENMGLVITGGSDYHGGELSSSLYSSKYAVEKCYLTRLKECAGIT